MILLFGGNYVRDRFLEIVVILISQLNEDHGRLDDIEEISAYLKTQGFSENEISTAYSWILDRLQTDTEFVYDNRHNGSASRVLSDIERQHFATDAIGYLMQLTHFGILSDDQVESVLERGMLIWPSPVSLEQIKILIDSILFSDSMARESSPDIQYYVAEDSDMLN